MSARLSTLPALLSGLLVVSCASLPRPGVQDAGYAEPLEPGEYIVFGEKYKVLEEADGYFEIGVASWYGDKFHGRLTANGETYDMHAVSAAHKTLPLPTFVRVTNLDNGKKLVVRVNDRGPFHDNRLIDLSYAAAQALGYADSGIAPVVVEAIDPPGTVVKAVASAKPVGGEDPATAAPADDGKLYLQVGAFSLRAGAVSLRSRVVDLLEQHALANIGVTILESQQGDKPMHKVWIGPMLADTGGEPVLALLSDANLPKPVQVRVD